VSLRIAAPAICSVALTCACTASAGAPPLLHELFQDHAVLQRDKPIRIWGRATPGESLNVSFAGQAASTRADASGRWLVTLPAMTAGGPHALAVTASSGAAQNVEDLLVGDVWLCSGQSNMVLPVHRALDSRAEIANSTNDSIRMLTAPQASSAAALTNFSAPVEWRKASPETVPEFSATCFYFARELQKTTGAPLGLINAAWGGSRIETWMSRSALQAVGGYEQSLAVLDLYSRDRAAASARWSALWESWWEKRIGGDPQTAPWNAQVADKSWRTAPRELGYWENWGVPELAGYNGMLWYRTTVTLTAKQASQSATLDLGRVDEVDQSWVNGYPVGAVAQGGQAREYQLPVGLLKAGDNVIVVNVLDTYGAGGLYGSMESRAVRFADGDSALLDGEWRYRMPPQDIGSPPRAPWEAAAGLSVIHNAMIAPLAGFGLRGVVWYQGESNTSEAARYQDLLTAFLADWRSRLGADLPFLIVQLANYGAPPTAPGESGWASLREAQRRVVAEDKHAGLAVAIDIGDRYDIHPANKQEVGRRLARVARHVVYGEAIAPSGPVPLAARRHGGAVVVTFGDVADRLIAYGAAGPIGFELCSAAACRYANALLEGDRVALHVQADESPTRVRYCWADSPVCTLFDESRLPAGPFEIEVQ